jgi:hypothetical protein
MAKKQRFQLRFTFWLDMLDSEGQDLADYVEQLKSKRSFAKTIRDGLRLVRDLRAGKVDVLFELFPWVKAEFIAGITPKPDGGSDDRMRREFEELKALILSTSNPPIVAAPAGSPRPLMAMGTATSGPQALSVPKFDLPRFDDDDDTDTLILAKDTRTDSAANFLNSMLALQQ